MTTQPTSFPYAVPAALGPDLARVLAYWEGLKRGAAEIPFWDDVRLTDLPDLAGRLALIDVFERPERFRIGVLGAQLQSTQETAVEGMFLDEVVLRPPLDLLRAQCAAAVERRAATYASGRLVLPLWGEGLVHMLLVAVAP